MTSLRAAIPGGPWTVDDLDAFPEGDTTRYELVDGALIVSAEPSLQHQRVNAQLLRLLQDAAPDDLEVFLPIDVRLSPCRQIAPDVTVVRRQERAAKRVTDVPLLVVEVQSPSTRAVDRALERQVLRRPPVRRRPGPSWPPSVRPAVAGRSRPEPEPVPAKDRDLAVALSR